MAARHHDDSHSSKSPARMLHSPKNRNCPSRNCRICVNMRRHAAGDINGSDPSMTSTRASAIQNVPLSKARASVAYFLAALAGAAVPLLPPDARMALKNSDDSSITIRSLFLSKLDL
jgi:hypothetical protein